MYSTTDSKLACALATLGAPLCTTDPVVRISEKVGERLAPETKTWNFDWKDVKALKGALDAWEKRTADQQLDRMLEELARHLASGEVPRAKLVEECEAIRAQLPFALVSYFRAFADNRERMIDLVKRAEPFVLIRKGAHKCVMLSKNAPEKVKRQFLRRA
jgi:hypothetical protein